LVPSFFGCTLAEPHRSLLAIISEAHALVLQNASPARVCGKRGQLATPPGAGWGTFYEQESWYRVPCQWTSSNRVFRQRKMSRLQASSGCMR
jgi:hypothetical protein